MTTRSPSAEVMAQARRLHHQHERANAACLGTVFALLAFVIFGSAADEAPGGSTWADVVLVVVAIAWAVVLIVWLVGAVITRRSPRELRVKAKAWRLQARGDEVSPWPGRIPDAFHTTVATWVSLVLLLPFTVLVGYRGVQGAVASLGLAGTAVSVHVTGFEDGSRGGRTYSGVIFSPAAQTGRHVTLGTGSTDGTYVAWPADADQVWPRGAVLWTVPLGLGVILALGAAALVRFIVRRLNLRRRWLAGSLTAHRSRAGAGG